jgi:uncharacterized membrane protein SpoIIM required for sporulation
MINLYRDTDFNKYILQSALIFCGFLIFGIMIGYLLPHTATAGVINYTLHDSASAKIIHFSDDPLFKVLLYFLNNSFVALLFAVILPLVYYRNLKEIDNTDANPVWLSRFVLAIQAILPGIFIGFAIPIINNNLLVVSSLLPHGIIEIYAFIIAASMGLWFINGKYLHTIGYSGLVKLYAVYILPMMFTAAVIEAYITPWIMTMVT